MSELGIIPDGAVVIEQGRITRVGVTQRVMSELDSAAKDLSSFVILDASGKAVLPGFVDSHTHLVFGGYRAEEYAWRLRGDSYMDILQRGGGILNKVRATRSASREELVRAGLKRLDSMLSFGVTTVEGKSGTRSASSTHPITPGRASFAATKSRKYWCPATTPRSPAGAGNRL